MNTQTKKFRMVDISANIPKSVQNEIIEAKERTGPFEKNKALRNMVGKRPKPTGGRIQTIINFIVGGVLIFVIVYFTIISHGGY